MSRSVVAVLRTTPASVLEDIRKLLQMAGAHRALAVHKTTILKDNISWHFPFLSANTTPWQLEGTILALKDIGCQDITAVHNNTVVTNSEKGQRLNKLAPVYEKYGIPEYENFDPGQIRWIRYEP